ncbi:MAG TPA: 3-oxoacyl-[acyl-carrier-protein] reductase [Candidatus Binatia bacterium]|nr:3-oxoacyl-[acyl-carrier-protein] reductase [Candidatus Binatia bacterium]
MSGERTTPLAGRVALVTGASRGIGRAIATELAARGARVAVNYRSNEEAARSAVAAIADAGGEAELAPFDVADGEAAAAAIAGLVDRHGRLDVLVNNAGIALDGLILRYKAADWQRIVDVNLSGVFHCCKAAARAMVRARSGRIVNVTSVVSAMGNAGQAPYAATKAGVEGLTRALARELASRAITVNAIAPGFIDTEMTEALPAAAREAYLAQVPLGRLGTAAEVAAAVAFLAGPDAGYITGHVLAVNGGLYM